MTAPKHFPPVEFLRECFAYDPETGLFRWRARPEHHFTDPRVFVRWCRHRAGTPAFVKPNVKGYLRACVTFNGREVELLAHRVAWALMTGEYPDDQVDHRNCDTADNRFTNLRAADQSENNMNRRTNVKKNGGLKGTSQNSVTGRWKATIQAQGHSRHLGYFDTAAEAHAAYVTAAANLFGEFARAA